MPSLPFVSRIDTRKLDWERIGQALMEYAGIPLAIFMTAGLIVRFLRGHGIYHEFFDPALSPHMYYVLNFWVVVGVYLYRGRFQKHLQLEQKREVGIAALAAFTWMLTQPLLLLIGYGAYLVAIMRKDQLSGTIWGRIFPDLAEAKVNPNDAEDNDEAWGHIQDVKENMSH